ncbi:MAG: hypothetical protein COB09_18940 [Thalassobium sp.]|nr:MAG: hypothetical protein COB09_18940 [Thalassobium sp.]
MTNKPISFSIEQTNSDQRITSLNTDEFELSVTVISQDEVSMDKHNGILRLISAAPDMLEALEYALKIIAANPDIGDAHLTPIRDAIKKATGAS